MDTHYIGNLIISQVICYLLILALSVTRRQREPVKCQICTRNEPVQSCLYLFRIYKVEMTYKIEFDVETLICVGRDKNIQFP